jgi:hypothetical protein
MHEPASVHAGEVADVDLLSVVDLRKRFMVNDGWGAKPLWRSTA